MTIRDLAKRLAVKENIDEEKVMGILLSLGDEIVEMLAEDEAVNPRLSIPSFGSFELFFDKRRNGYRLKFKESKSLISKMKSLL